MSAPLLQLENISKTYTVSTFSKKFKVRALHRINLDVQEKEVLGIVGESGSGKSTMARIMLKLLTPDQGAVHYTGNRSEFRREVQVVFQNPYASLNPLKTVYGTLKEVVQVHRLCPKKEIAAHIKRGISDVGLSEEVLPRLPAQLSGGQRQRVALCRSLLLLPRLLVCDEITSALDYITANKIVRMLMSIKNKTGMSLVFIAHNIQLVSMIADRIAIFYNGELVETGDTPTIIESPAHPYTQALIKAATYEELR